MRKVTVRPLYPNASRTIHFGLGNAVIALNLDSLPERIVQPITGETTKEGITPTSPFGLKRWFAAPANIRNTPPTTITGYDGYSEKITFQEAESCSIKEVSSVEVVQNGYGSEKILPQLDRLGW